MKKAKFAVKMYTGGSTPGYAIFKASSVRNIGDTVTWEHDAEPFRGYSGLTQLEANSFKNRLEKELK